MNANHAAVQAGVAVSVALGVMMVYRNRNISDNGVTGGEGPLSVSGLRNVGNTCFINAVLQSLASLPPFVEYLKALSPLTDGPGRPFTVELSRLMDNLRPIRPLSPLAPLSPRNLQGLLAEKVERFANFDQQDAQELFQMVMQLVSEEAVNKLDDDDDDDIGLTYHRTSVRYGMADGCWGCHGLLDKGDNTNENELEQMQSRSRDKLKLASANPLCGTLVSTTRCAQCGQTSSKADAFVDLSLTLPEARAVSREYAGNGMVLGPNAVARSVDLDTVLKEYTQEELVEGAECSKCSKHGRVSARRGAYKHTLLGRPPETLCLHFPRRHPSPHGFMMKLEQHVKFPLQLDVTRFCYAGGDRIDGIAAPHARAAAQSKGLSQGQGLGKSGASYPEPGRSSPVMKSNHDTRMTRSPRSWVEKNHALLGGSVEGAGMASSDSGRKRIDDLTRGEVASIVGNAGPSVVPRTSPCTQGTIGREGVEYDLRAVIVHDGGADAGHYKAYRNLGSGQARKAMKERPAPGVLEQTRRMLCRGASDTHEGPWVSLSDETVQTVSVADVLASQAYMLFYRRIGRAPHLELG